MSSDAELSKRLRRLAERLDTAPRESRARYDELMDIHDEIVKIASEISREINDPQSQ